jgi:hypothetical protein
MRVFEHVCKESFCGHPPLEPPPEGGAPMNLPALLALLKSLEKVSPDYMDRQLAEAIAMVEAAIKEGPEKSLETLAAEQGIEVDHPSLCAIMASAPDGLEDFERRKAPDWRELAIAAMLVLDKVFPCSETANLIRAAVAAEKGGSRG